MGWRTSWAFVGVLMMLTGAARSEQTAAPTALASQKVLAAFECANLAAAVVGSTEFNNKADRLARYAVAISPPALQFLMSAPPERLGPLGPMIQSRPAEFWLGIEFATASETIHQFITTEVVGEGLEADVIAQDSRVAKTEYDKRNCDLIGQ